MTSAWQPLRPLSKALLAKAAKHGLTRQVLNAWYGQSTWTQKADFHSAFAKIFRGRREQVAPGNWIVEFLGSKIEIPIRPEQAWLDWDLAVSVLGHGIEIKKTYDRLMRTALRPDLFIDVGSNYGTHALLFIAQGVDTLCFEPNPSCNQYFRWLCDRNGWAPRIEEIALGAEQSSVELAFPERETWLGTTDPRQASLLASGCPISTVTVEQRTLDSYFDQIAGRRSLIKIDAEGSEPAILEGAMRVLREIRPHLIFESHPTSDACDRLRLFELFTGADYRIARLPWNPERPMLVLGDRDSFGKSSAHNFYAVPLS